MAKNYMVHRHRDVQGGAARAAVFGVSDGLVSNIGLVLGVAAAGTPESGVLLAGMSALLAGAFSMAAGEYVSVKAQAELIERELAIERESIRSDPEEETLELASIYQSRGLSSEDAYQIADSVMADPEIALEVHAREELGVDPKSVGDPVRAASTSFLAFAVGATLPLLPWFVVDGTTAIVASLVVGISSAAFVGMLLAIFTERSKILSAARQASIAAVCAAITFGLGLMIGASI